MSESANRLPARAFKLDGNVIFVSNQKDAPELAIWAYVENQREVMTLLWNNHPESTFYGKGEMNHKASLYTFKDGVYMAPENLDFEVIQRIDGDVSARVIRR